MKWSSVMQSFCYWQRGVNQPILHVPVSRRFFHDYLCIGRATDFAFRIKPIVISAQWFGRFRDSTAALASPMFFWRNCRSRLLVNKRSTADTIYRHRHCVTDVLTLVSTRCYYLQNRRGVTLLASFPSQYLIYTAVPCTHVTNIFSVNTRLFSGVFLDK